MIAEQDRPDRDGSVAAAIRGDRQAISLLWQQHRRWVAAVLLTYKPPEADLEDLLQEVAMRLLSKIGTLRDEANLRAWLRAVAVNVARSAARGSRSPRSVPGPTLQAIPDRHDARDLDQRGRELMALVRQLPENYREPLLLRAVHGLRTRQIGEILDLAPAAVDTRIARARRLLRERAERDEVGCSAFDPDALRGPQP